MKDADIVREVLAGERDSFGILVRRHFGAIYALSLANTRNPMDAEDATQEAFARCYSKLDTLRDPNKFASWVAVVARNLCRDRHREPQADTFDPELMAGDPSADVQAQVERSELIQLVRRLIAALPPETREAVFLYYLEERSTHEIGEMVDKSPNAVARLLKYGRERLQENLWAEAQESRDALRPTSARVGQVIAVISATAVPWSGSSEAAAATGSVVLGATRAKQLAGIAALGVPLLVIALWPMEKGDAEIPTARMEAVDSAPPVAPGGVATGASAVAVDAGEQLDDESGANEPLESLLAAIATLSTPSEDRPRSLLVTGSVIDTEGYPIAGAVVSVALNDHPPDARIEVKTRTDGTYRLEGLRGKHDLQIYASAKGRMMQSRNVPLAATEFREIDFTLPAAGYSISGTVVDPEGHPVVARIDQRLSGYTLASPFVGGRFPAYKIYTWSDTEGHFDLGVSFAGAQTLVAYSPGYAAGVYEGIPADTTDARLVMRRGGTITGRLSHPDGTPAVNHRVYARGDALFSSPELDSPYRLDFWHWTSLSDENGIYWHTNAASDASWDLLVQDPGAVGWGAPGHTLAVRKNIRVEEGESQTIDFVLGEVGQISGVVVDPESGRPVTDLIVLASIQDTESEDPTSPWARTVLGPDGRYTLELPITQTQVVAIDLRYPDRPVSTSVFPFLRQSVPTVSLAPGESAVLDLAIPAPFSVEGIVVDDAGTPMGEIPIFLAPHYKGTGSAISRVGETDATGRIARSGLNPFASYSLFANDPTQGHAQQIAGRSFRMIGYSPKFGGSPLDVVEVEIAVVRKGGLEGALVDAAGLPVSNVRFVARALLSNGKISSEMGVTDAEGGFVLLRAVPLGYHDQVVLATRVSAEEVNVVVLTEVEIGGDEIIDVGTLAMATVTLEVFGGLLDKKAVQ